MTPPLKQVKAALKTQNVLLRHQSENYATPDILIMTSGLGLKHQHATEAKQQLCCLLNTC